MRILKPVSAAIIDLPAFLSWLGFVSRERMVWPLVEEGCYGRMAVFNQFSEILSTSSVIGLDVSSCPMLSPSCGAGATSLQGCQRQFNDIRCVTGDR